MNWENFSELIIRFTLNIAVNLVIIRYLYYTSRRRKDYLFTYLLISTVIFLLCYMLVGVKLELGFALGLFAIFGIIRYRTRQIPIKEMTYLFLVIGISVMNALSSEQIGYLQLGFTNFALLFITYLLEKKLYLKHETKKVIEYDKIGMVKPTNRKRLIQDLEERTGLKINRVKIEKIDFLHESARIILYYYDNENEMEEE